MLASGLGLCDGTHSVSGQGEKRSAKTRRDRYFERIVSRNPLGK